jgi:hypothetical protein
VGVRVGKGVDVGIGVGVIRGVRTVNETTRLIAILVTTNTLITIQTMRW